MTYKITPEEASYHIDTSLDNGRVNVWHDEEEDVTWVVRGRDGSIVFEFTDAEGNETTQVFRLIEV